METSKRLGNPSILRRLGALELQLKPIRNQGDKLRIGGFAFAGIYGVAEKGIQSATYMEE